MGDLLHILKTKENQSARMVIENSGPRQAIAIIPMKSPEKSLKRIGLMDHSVFGMGAAIQIGQFLCKMAALEALRRFSKAHCPPIWRGIQALQIFCYHPFSWIQKWAPFKWLFGCLKMFSKPVLALSVATPFFDQSADVEEILSSSHTSQMQIHVKGDSIRSAERAREFEETVSRLLMELQKEGVVLPERINQDELLRFYDAVDGNFSSFLYSIWKTINWRKNFTFLSVEQLDRWSRFVFWHGHDVKQRPCLFICLGLVFSSMASTDRSCLTDVVVSQIEYGVLHLLNPKEPQLTVVMDCYGLTSFHFPVQIMRSCAILLQDHYPNCLAALFIIRLAPFARVIGQTLFQVLRPATRRKLRIEGANYKKTLSKYIEMLPSSVGGDCLCPICSNTVAVGSQDEKSDMIGSSAESFPLEGVISPLSDDKIDGLEFLSSEKLSGSTILGIFMLLIILASLALQVYHAGGV